MATLEQMRAALSAIDVETTRIGVYIESILAQLNRTDLTAEEEEALLVDLQAAADRLKGVGKTPEVPIPVEPELPPVPPVE